MHPLAALLAACAIYVGAMPVVNLDYEKHIEVRLSGGFTATARIGGELVCSGGRPTIYLYRMPAWVDITTLITHEALHAVQCVHEGAITAAPFALDPMACGYRPTDCPHSWVHFALDNPAQAVQIIEALPR